MPINGGHAEDGPGQPMWESSCGPSHDQGMTGSTIQDIREVKGGSKFGQYAESDKRLRTQIWCARDYKTRW